MLITPTDMHRQMNTPEGLPVLHHEVDSIESWAACKTGDARDTSRLLAYVVVQEGITAVCHVFRAPDKKTRDSVLTTLESALYADVKSYKVRTHHNYDQETS